MVGGVVGVDSGFWFWFLLGGALSLSLANGGVAVDKLFFFFIIRAANERQGSENLTVIDSHSVLVVG